MSGDSSTAVVLVVDDEQMLAELFETFLSEAYAVRTAFGGKEALEKLDDDVDAALFDRRMPGMTGDELLEEVRERDYDIPVAMVTGVDADTGIIDMPFDDYLEKPVDREELVETVDVLLKRSDYDSKSREFFRLASKKAALGSPHDCPEIETINNRMREIREEIDDTLSELIEEDNIPYE